MISISRYPSNVKKKSGESLQLYGSSIVSATGIIQSFFKKINCSSMRRRPSTQDIFRNQSPTFWAEERKRRIYFLHTHKQANYTLIILQWKATGKYAARTHASRL